MRLLLPLIAVVVLIVIAYAGVSGAGMNYLFGVFIPYLAFAIFVVGFISRIVKWARSPVPFRIPTTCGQEKSLPWIKRNSIDNPFTTGEVFVRMLLEIFLFRSLFRNVKSELNGGKLAYGSAKWLWLAGLAFHYAFLVTLIRHLRFFTEPVPFFVKLTNQLDGILQAAAPALQISGVVILIAGAYLLARRLFSSRLRYISLAADYFPLFLILAITITGILMRYFFKTHIVGIKELTMGLVSFSPKIPEGVGVLFYIHLFLVSVLFAYFPFSKLMHLGGIFLSPTRNLANNNRAVRHINPWNYPVKVHTYEEYEDEFREKMKEAGIPVEKE